MSVGRFRPSSNLLLLALLAGVATACSLDTRATAAANPPDAGPGEHGGSAAGGSGVGGHGGGGGTSGGSSGGSAGSGATGGGPDGGFAGSENCLDGKDNDSNGFVDCGDPACASAGYTCQPGPPKGWQGYFRTAGDAFDTTASPPVCPDGNPPIKYRAEPAPSTCTPCTCGALTGACAPARIDCAENTDCSGATDWTAKFQSCSQIGYPSSLSCRLEPASPSGSGTCPPSGGELSVKEPWGRWLYVCGGPNTAGGGCVPDQACAAPGAGAYSGSVCIRKAGEQKCPAGWGTRLLGYTGGTDTRGCSACSCKPVASSFTCSGGAYTFYDHNSCDCAWWQYCAKNKVVDSTQCVDLSNLLSPSAADVNGDWGGNYTSTPSASGGSCTPSGGQPTGGIDKTGAMTYCCL